MEKVKLTVKQAEMIKNHDGHLRDLMFKWHAKGCSTFIDDLTAEQVLDAYFDGYEVEEEYKVGDKIVHLHDRHPGVYTVREVHFHGVLVGEFFDLEFRIKDIRHATPEEIKAEQERRVWKSIGREVGEFKANDVFIDKKGMPFIFASVTHLSSGIITLKTAYEWHRIGNFKGLYPAESFVELSGESHDN